VPWPYRVEESPDIFGWGFALMPRLPGAPWRRAAEGLEAEAYRELAAAIGTGLAEMHAARVPSAGEYDPQTGGIAAESSFAVWVERGLRSWQARAAEVLGALDVADVDFIDSVLAEARGALEEPFEPCFVHYDFAGDNVLVGAGPNGWRLSGIVDLMTCAAGDAEQDLSRMAASLAVPDRSIAAAFVDAYCAQSPLRPGARERFRLYMLMDRLVLWEYGRRHDRWFPKHARFRRFARPFLELADLVA
jgi:Ser/Thr protein kinase RdoA (MazF antagonist)